MTDATDDLKAVFHHAAHAATIRSPSILSSIVTG